MHSALHAPRLRLVYLDGIRGLAALFVVAYHLHQELTVRGGLPRRFLAVTKWMQLGHFAVGVFIVLSGFSLMIPVVRSADGKIPGGLGDYFRRRARRILPAYYAALILTLLMDWCIPGLQRFGNCRWDQTLPSFRLDVILSHLLLIHNLNQDWIFKINGPFWSVATEWQIYFAFPLLLIPVWRRLGATVMVFTALVVGVGGASLLPNSLGCACSWYLALFAFGMSGAVISFSRNQLAAAIRERVRWGLLTLTLGAALAMAIKLVPSWLIFEDCLDGLTTTCLLVRLTQQSATTAVPHRSPMLRLLESPATVAMGAVSYSLYLIHSPLLSASNVFVNWAFSPTPILRACLLSAVAVPVISVSTVLFYFAVERGGPRRSQVSRLTPRELVPEI